MKIICDTFNYDLLKDCTNVVLQDSYDIDQNFDVMIANWKRINFLLQTHQQKIHQKLFIVSAYSDVSNLGAWPISELNSYNSKNSTSNKIFMIGDGVGAWKSQHIISPYSRFLFLNNDFLKPNQDGTHWTCLMGKDRTHRLAVESWLMQNNNIFDYPNDYVFDYTLFVQKTQPLMFRPIQKMLKYVDHDRSHINTQASGGIVNWYDGDLIEPYHRSRIELVVETETKYFFITEKTTKPIRAGIPFVMIAQENYLKKLKQLGFKTFHPYINESYDQESNLGKRVDQACRAFYDYIKNPQFKLEINKICIHNQQKLRHIQSKYNDFKNLLTKKIQGIINRENYLR